jgi:Icc-related predicted phosphoesterase
MVVISVNLRGSVAIRKYMKFIAPITSLHGHTHAIKTLMSLGQGHLILIFIFL